MRHKKICSFLLIICFILSLAGCKPEDFKLYYEIQTEITTADPQLAKSDSELLLIKNIFEGLYRLNSENKAVDGAAECKVSKSGLVYTFTIKDNAKWRDGTPLTADDFAFGIERALTRTTGCPYAQSLFCISNAENFYNGTVDFNNVGIKVQGDSKLTITLEAPYADFPYILASSCAMPCNREFFKSTKGQYGLNKKSILSNGSFYVGDWDEENGFVLNKSTDYDGDFKATAYAVYLSLADDNDTAGRLLEENIDGGRILYNAENRLPSKDFTISKFPVSTYSLVFNSSISKELRSILIGAVDFKSVKKELSGYMTPTDTIIPLTLKNKGGAITYPQYDKASAHDRFLQYSKEYGSPTLTVLCINDNDFSAVLKKIITYWQTTLGAYGINIEYVDTEAELSERLQNGNYAIAFAPFNDNGGTVYDFLFTFSNASAQNYLNRHYGSFDSYLAEYSNNGSNEALKNALSALSNEYSIVPICSVNKIYAISNDFKNAVFFNFGGEIDFSMITK